MKSMEQVEGPIVVLDSGVGGLPYLQTARELLPDEEFVYFADRAGFPYGTKSSGQVLDVVLDRVDRLIALCSPKAVVIACNTASQAALAGVRSAHPDLAVIGTVPAVKPAIEHTKTGTIGVMATARTVEDPYLDGLIEHFAGRTRVLREPAQDLVAFVEWRLLDASEEERRAAVRPHVLRLVEAGADQLVIACTHFLHVAAEISSVAGPGVAVVDSREGVARRLAAVLRERGLLRFPPAANQLSGGGHAFILSGCEPIESRYFGFASRFTLDEPTLLAVGTA